MIKRLIKAVGWLVGSSGLVLLGWNVENNLPVKKGIIIVAHHTTNWDFIIGMLTNFKLGIFSFWIAKSSAFFFPVGIILRALRGIPIDRSSAHDVVNQVVEIIHAHEEMYLTITPEGRRKKVDYWKSGFYHMAIQAQVPLVCAAFDYRTRTIWFSKAMNVTGNIKRDMDEIRNFYADVVGKYPENHGTIRLRSENA